MAKEEVMYVLGLVSYGRKGSGGGGGLTIAGMANSWTLAYLKSYIVILISYDSIRAEWYNRVEYSRSKHYPQQ